MSRFAVKLFFGCVLLGLVACEREIELDLPVEQKLVLLSNFSPDSMFRVSLSASILINNASAQEPEYPADASIQLYENEIYIGDFVYRPGNALLVPAYILGVKPKPGSSYSIRASTPSYPAVSASNIIPPPVAMGPLLADDISVMEDDTRPGVFSYQLFTALAASVSQDTQQYFHVLAWRNMVEVSNGVVISTYKRPLGISFGVNIPLTAIQHERGYLLDATAFRAETNGIPIRISFQHNSNTEWKTPVYVELRHVSQDYYRFHKSVGEQELIAPEQSLLSTEAYFIHNNIKGGIGNFSGYSMVLDSLDY
jgi:Domain of unknown function (DUF4249)